jgi:hypothetical protein
MTATADPKKSSPSHPSLWESLMRRRELLGLAAAVAGAGVLMRIAPGRAQALGGKQIRVVVPFPAGGPTDIVARPLAQMLGDGLNAVIMIDNRGGAGGSIGADAVAKSAPDGQTLLVGPSAPTPSIRRSMPSCHTIRWPISRRSPWWRRRRWRLSCIRRSP